MICAGFLSVSHRISGPLLWHFEETATSDPSIELDLEEVKALAVQIGFDIKVRVFGYMLTWGTGLTAVERTQSGYDLCEQQGFDARLRISCGLLDSNEEVVVFHGGCKI
jgi:hypothetical protein